MSGLRKKNPNIFHCVFFLMRKHHLGLMQPCLPWLLCCSSGGVLEPSAWVAAGASAWLCFPAAPTATPGHRRDLSSGTASASINQHRWQHSRTRRFLLDHAWLCLAHGQQRTLDWEKRSEWHQAVRTQHAVVPNCSKKICPKHSAPVSPAPLPFRPGDLC